MIFHMFDKMQEGEKIRMQQAIPLSFSIVTITLRLLIGRGFCLVSKVV